MRKRNKIFLLLAGFLGMILILSFALYFSAARVINTDTVKEKLRVYTLEKTGAVVGYGTSEVHLFPLPKIIFHRVDISIPDKAQGTVESLSVYPGLWPLLRGELRIAKLSLEAPRFTVDISTDEEKPPLEVIEKKLRALVHYVVTNSPGLVVTIRDGKFDLTEADEVAFTFDAIQFRLSASRKNWGLTWPAGRTCGMPFHSQPLCQQMT